MSKRLLFLLVAVLALGVTAAGCGNDEKASTSIFVLLLHVALRHGPTATAKSSADGEGVESGSAELRAGLTALLEEHVYLAGIAVVNGVGNGLDSKRVQGRRRDAGRQLRGARRRRSASVYGDDAGKQFLALWRKHIGFFVDYTQGKATKDAKLVAKSRSASSTATAPTSARSSPRRTRTCRPTRSPTSSSRTSRRCSPAIDSVVAGKGDAFDEAARPPRATCR